MVGVRQAIRGGLLREALNREVWKRGVVWCKLGGSLCSDGTGPHGLASRASNAHQLGPQAVVSAQSDQIEPIDGEGGLQTVYDKERQYRC